uniref:Uncharacterized protein n=1 Tax=Rhizophora mucronata TaxID=61149 RepID=A0A2P2P0D2_RHIMU
MKLLLNDLCYDDAVKHVCDYLMDIFIPNLK